MMQKCHNIGTYKYNDRSVLIRLNAATMGKICESIPAASIAPCKPPGKLWIFEKKLVKCPALSCGQFLLANAPPTVPTMMVKCPASRSPVSPSDQYTELLVAIF